MENYSKAIKSIDKHCFVSAGAGTGKTYVLTNRYLEVILNGGLTEEIVALTFTRKAAAEMSERIRIELSKRLKDEKRADIKEHLKNAISSLYKSRISTFHSFFADILKVFAVEAGVDTDFRLIEPSEFQVIMQKEIESLLSSMLAENNVVLLDLLSKYSMNEINITVLSFSGINDTKLKAGLENIVSPERKEISDAFFNLYDEVQKRIKIPADILDYHMVECKAAELFCRKDLQQAMIKRLKLKHLFIDEFQDTNFLQRDIIYRLCGIDPESETPQFPKSPKLFIVGDEKQSIYRFRDAQVEVFSCTRRDYESAEKKDGSAIVLNIDECRRTSETLGTFFNSFFNCLLNKDKCETYTDIKFDPDKKISPKGIGKAAIRIFGNKTTDGDSSLKLHTDEAQWIASQIAGLKKDGYDFKDICILRHSVNGAGMPELRNALALAGIPFYVSGLRGLMDCQAITDIIQWFNILAHSDNDIALAACAKQPCFGLTDKDFMLIQSAEQEDFLAQDGYEVSSSFISRLKFATFKNNAVINGKLKKFNDTLKSLKEIAGTVPVAKLASEIIVKCKMIESWAAMPDKPEARRYIGNIETFLFNLRQSDWGSLSDVFLFCEALNSGAVFSDDSGEAQLCSESDDVVKIMTIHQSKGLEFKVVFVSKVDKLGHESKSNGCAVFFKGDQLMVNIHKEDAPFEKIKNDSFKDPKALQELKRGFYVALTRAKERLFISGSVKVLVDGKAAKDISYDDDDNGAEWLLKYLLPENANIPEGVWPGPEVDAGQVWGGYPVPETLTPIFLQSITSTTPVQAVKMHVPERINILNPSVNVIPMTTPVTPSELKPTGGHIKRPDNIKENDLGTIVHAFFAEWDFNEKNIKKYAEEISSIYAEADKNVTEYIESCAKAFLTVQWKDKKLASIFAENIDSGRLMREYPFCYQKDDNGKIYQVQGIIDVLLTMPDGSLQIFDYKTGKEHEEYANQMTAYCEAFNGRKIHSDPVLMYF